MASKISQGVEKVVTMASNGITDKKHADLHRDTVNIHDNKHFSTTDFGTKVATQDDWLRVVNDGRTGPSLLEDQIAREKIHRFDHERIPERVVHARGAGAFGSFRVYESAEDVTHAKVLTDTSRTTPVFIRFSTVQGSRGSADTVRDVRGFAIKFYTEEGNWDIVGNDIPVFFIQDAMKFPDIVHAVKPEPDREVPQAQSAHNNFWDFQYLHSEATHMFMWAMSDRGVPRSFRMMQGFGVNTFRLINKDGISHFVKFHFTPTLGVHSLVWDEALKLSGQDPDFHRKDLYEAIDEGVYPKWKFGIQTLPDSRQDDFDFDILDATKIWPEEDVPIRYIGELELNRNIDEFFTQVEQAAFCTSHIVPGIDFSDDPLLQGRNFSYFDTQLSRLGINWQELPINRPGRHRITAGKVNYWPNRFEAVPPVPPSEGGFNSFPEKIQGIAERLKSKKFSEHINQAQLFYNSLTPPEKYHLENALGFELDHCDEPIVYERICDRLRDIDLELAKNVATLVGAPVPEKEGRPNHGKKSKSLSQTYFMPSEPTIASRRVAILIGDGFDKATVKAMQTSLKAANAFPFVIGVRRSTIYGEGEDKSSSSAGMMPAHHLEGMRSTMFDALFIPGGSHNQTLQKNGRAIHWVREAFAHCKAIGAMGEAVELIKTAIGSVDKVKLASVGEQGVIESYGVVTAGKSEASGIGEMIKMLKGAKDFAGAFFYSISCHRHFEREMEGLSSMVAY
ncbi:Catalase A [Endocarpon pusillum Z07020]|uniref:Catalase n=1 Tax=Endocarpon pusillum (strain Z07020 / HMAS-L-300199) TaxID=1263415 RepID=U1GVH2_ENDPU|nr:Catalase A [Endocarpon pusillum Z07020]ERF76056.1 Catalase A [Endocarpon pusillum Z07020]